MPWGKIPKNDQDGRTEEKKEKKQNLQGIPGSQN